MARFLPTGADLHSAVRHCLPLVAALLVVARCGILVRRLLWHPSPLARRGRLPLADVVAASRMSARHGSACCGVVGRPSARRACSHTVCARPCSPVCLCCASGARPLLFYSKDGGASALRPPLFCSKDRGCSALAPALVPQQGLCSASVLQNGIR